MTSIIVSGRYGPQVVNAVSDNYLSGAFRLYGEYGEQEVALLRALLRPGMVALDIGANLGALTLPMARMVGPEGVVIAWEPQPRAHRRLVASLELNNLTWVWAERVAADRSVGAALRDAAIQRASEGRQEQIQRVRVALLAFLAMTKQSTFTADEVYRIAHHLGFGGGDTRWLAAVVKGWPEVEATKEFVPSTLPQRHCRPVRVWVRK